MLQDGSMVLVAIESGLTKDNEDMELNCLVLGYNDMLSNNTDLRVRMEGDDINLMQNTIGKGWLGKNSEDLKLRCYGFLSRDSVLHFVNETVKCLED
eukprot:8484902-Ditylum_brightwellii.AAC.1